MTVHVTGVTTVLTDIEGTTSPIAFVKETLFPYARSRMAGFLADHRNEADVSAAIAQAAAAGGVDARDLNAVTALLIGWIDQDAKVAPLKTIQGLIWRHGYQAGDLKGAIFDDAVLHLRAWAQEGARLAVYSSGSVLAQKLLFGSTPFGDLTPLFTGFFDTAVGTKREAGSYRRIAQMLGQPAEEILFLSDIAEELDAAAEAGMRTVQLVRAGEGTLASSCHPVAATFTDIEIGGVLAPAQGKA